MRDGGWSFGEGEDGGERKKRENLRDIGSEDGKTPREREKSLPFRHPLGRKTLEEGEGGRWGVERRL